MKKNEGFRRLAQASILSSTIVLGTVAPDAKALTIVRNYIGGTPGDVAGGGDLDTIFNAAADLWEETIQDEYTLTINYGWAPRSGNTLANISLIQSPTVPVRVTSGTALFDNDTFSWFADATPFDNVEYGSFIESTLDLGGGAINQQRDYINPSGDAIGRFDLFTVALHEIGHGVNVWSGNPIFQVDSAPDRDLDIPVPYPFAGSEIPTTDVGGGHINLSSPVMYPFIPSGRRKLLTEIDIVSSAYLSDFQSFNLNPQQQEPEAPEPPSGELTENGSFEQGTFESWQTIGNTSLETAAFGFPPTDGQFQALLSTDGTFVSDTELESFLELSDGQLDQLSDQLLGFYPEEDHHHGIEALDIADSGNILDSLGNGNATFGSAIKQTFTANVGDILSFDWNFLTNEGTPSIFNDFGFVSIGPLETLADTNATFVNSLSAFGEETGYQKFSFALPETGEYTLGLGVVDVQDSLVASGLLVDNVRLTRSRSVPEPSIISALAALGLLGLGKRMQKRRSV